jgi:hypothetical protein
MSKMSVLDRAEIERRFMKMGQALAVVWTTMYILQHEDHSKQSNEKILERLLSLAKEANRFHRDLFGWDVYDLAQLRKKFRAVKG